MKKEFKPFAFIDKKGNKVTEDGPMVGKAYGFFYCSASKQEIERELPRSREMAQTPSELELSLIEGMDNIRGNEELTTLAQEAKQNGINYMLETTYPNATNRSAADELANIFNMIYVSPLYQKGDR